VDTRIAVALVVVLVAGAALFVIKWATALRRAWRAGDPQAMRVADRYGVVAVVGFVGVLVLAAVIYVVTSVDEWS
jgi:uncharacterized BrkB/YihY/UPF0761 family membrane protein